MVRCDDCGWMGDERECIYYPEDMEEEIMTCPKCGGNRLAGIDEDPAILELVPA